MQEIANGFKALVWLILIGVLVYYVACSDTNQPATSRGTVTPVAEPEHEEVEAWVMCQDFIEDRLVSPGSAKYPWGYSDYTTYLGDGSYRVRAYVDSQNSFGALIRTQFECKITYVGDETWHLDSLAFDE